MPKLNPSDCHKIYIACHGEPHNVTFPLIFTNTPIDPIHAIGKLTWATLIYSHNGKINVGPRHGPRTWFLHHINGILLKSDLSTSIAQDVL